MRIYLRSGKSIDTDMKHGDLTDLMQDQNYDFVIIPDMLNESKLYNIRKDAIEMIEVQG